ncbi:MAG: endopeptidase La [Spirochaetales bacterium]|nr:MAG: endopeptidase La [Spirochaetales bacterium]
MKRNKLRPEKQGELPLIPLRELVIFPYNVSPFFVGRQGSINAMENAVSAGKEVFLVFQKSSDEDPGPEDIHPVGTIARVVQVLKLPDGNLRVLVEGHRRAFLKKVHRKNNITWGRYQIVPENEADQEELKLLMQTLKDDFRQYAGLRKKKLSREAVTGVLKAETSDKLVGSICTALDITAERKIPFLLETDACKRLEELSVFLRTENQLLTLRQGISERVKKRMERSQKEYFLNEQIKEIHKELGSEEADPTGARELERKVLALDLSDEVRAKAQIEIKRLSRLQPMSPESGVLRTYLEWITDLPWNVRTTDSRDISQASRLLDAQHYGLEKPKERILDFIAVRQLKTAVKSPILCFVGPPGTGKTSLGRSVAEALGRKFVRISLGGVRDEAEIRGHRKTYVGALPGKIIQAVKRAGSANPVFLLDEVDKMSNDYRGDPSSALLEVLDPEQNSTFTDHYLEVPFNLSEVMFITTANSLEKIPHPLRDRMEIIRVPGYTMTEKKNIARQFIIPKQKTENGLENSSIRFPDESLELLIRGYTLEAGVRNMERAISQVMRKITRNILHEQQTRPGRWVINSAALHQNQTFSAVYRKPEDAPPEISGCDMEITPEMVRRYLGKERLEDDLGTAGRPGLAPGLYYDGGGGGVLPVEARIFDGSEKLILTGQLGDVMKESAQIALSYLKANRGRFGLKAGFDRKKDIHIHVPQGAIPVDGPSAGIALSAALLSAALGIPLKTGIAMTGEITLTDRVLPIGGVKEKSLAARRRGFSTIVMPEDNRRDVEELPPEVRSEVTFLFHKSLSEALESLFPEGSFE